MTIEDLNKLYAQRADLQARLDALAAEREKLAADLQRVLAEEDDITQQQEEVQRQAAALVEKLFGIPRPVEPTPPPPQPVVVGSTTPPRKLDNSIVFDHSVPLVASGAPVPPEKAAVDALGGFSF